MRFAAVCRFAIVGVAATLLGAASCRVGAQLLKCQNPCSCLTCHLHVASSLACCSGPAEWVRSYSSAEYLRLPAKAEALLDETGGAEDFGECSLAC